MSFRFIEDHRDTYPVRLICAVLEVSPAGYYAWRERPVSVRATANSVLLAEASAMAAPGSKPSCGRRGVAPAAAGSNG